MGLSTDPKAFAAKCRQTAHNLAEVEGRAVAAAARTGQDLMMATANLAGAGGRRGVKVKTRSATSSGRPAVALRWGPNAGWVKIMDAGTAPHFIASRKGGSLRRQRSRRGSRRATLMEIAPLFGKSSGEGARGAINIPGVGPRAYAHHPGSRGHHFVQAANAAAAAAAKRELAKMAVAEFGKAFR